MGDVMRVLLAVLGLLIAGSTHAAQLWVPANLESWRGWALKDQEFRRCPLIAGTRAAERADFVCAWPGVLTINADDAGATLSQRWHMDADGWGALAGDDEHWPQQVTLDGVAAPVVDRDGPMLWLSPDRQPRSACPPGLVAASADLARTGLDCIDRTHVDGKPVLPLQRGNDRSLTLGRGASGETAGDSVDLRVFRKFSDILPGQLTTLIRIHASGQARRRCSVRFSPKGLCCSRWTARRGRPGWMTRVACMCRCNPAATR